MRLIRKRKRRNRTFSWSLLNVARIGSLLSFSPSRLPPSQSSLTENITTTLPSFLFLFSLVRSSFLLHSSSFLAVCEEERGYFFLFFLARRRQPATDCVSSLFHRLHAFNGEQNENGTFDSKEREREEKYIERARRGIQF